MWKIALGQLLTVGILLLLLPRKPTIYHVVQPPPNQRHVIGNINYGDTLFLFAGYSECGEWGGHRELLKIYLLGEKSAQQNKDLINYQRAPFTAAFFLDTIRCSYRPDRRYFLVKRRVINVDDEKYIVQYLQALQTHSLKQGRSFRIGRIYWAGTRKEKPQLWVYNAPYGWEGFSALREKLFGESKTPDFPVRPDGTR